MTEHEKSRKHYEQSGTYDQNMEYFEECEVNSGAWVLITRQIPVDERCKPHLFGIYWGIPKQDRFDRQVCVVHTTEDVTLLNHEFTVIKDCAYTITTRQDRTPAQVIDRGDGRYRYLTERECWRLMGYTDEDFDRAKAVQERNGKYYKALYDQAGNSIAVPIFESIFRKIILQEVA